MEAAAQGVKVRGQSRRAWQGRSVGVGCLPASFLVWSGV